MSPIALTDAEGDSCRPLDAPTSSVFPHADADIKLRKLWVQHGDIQSPTYANPDLTSLGSLVTYNARTRPDQVAYLVPRDDTFVSIKWQHFDQLTDHAAAQYSRAFKHEIESGLLSGLQPTVALYGTGNTFGYWVSEVALLKLGVRVLLLSDKNADVARDHLLRACVAVGIVVEQKYITTVQELSIPVVPLVPVALSWAPSAIPKYNRFESDDVWNQQAMVIHSSGSTGLPKPIIHTNRSMMLIARMYRLFQSFVVENWYLCFPLYHIAGVSIILGGLPTGLPTSFPPETWPPSPGSILGAWRRLAELGRPVDCLHCAPAVIEDLYEYLSLSPKADYSPLTDLKILQPGGAALSPAVLQKLINLGVNVKTTYGSTEIGPPYRTIPDSKNASCYRVRSLFPNDTHVTMEPQGEDLYECVVYRGFPLAAELWLDPDAPNPYRTNDLFIQDPPNSGLYVLQGRKDDILVHSNGEKTNALALQMALEEAHPCIHKTVVFGTDKPCTSAIIELRGNLGSEEIFNAISRACDEFPSFSRLDRSLILMLPEGKSLPVTPKGNVRRKEALALYGDRLESLYKQAFDGTEESEGDADFASMCNLDFVRTCVATACNTSIDLVQSKSNFYTIGLDSQKAVRLRSRLSRRFGKFPLMFIFEFPSADQLCKQLSSASKAGSSTTVQRNHAYIQDAIVRYTDEILSWIGAPTVDVDRVTGEVLYLTGATGALGNALLATFDADPRVAKVYCAIRGQNARARLGKSLRDRGYATKVCQSSKFVDVPYDMGDAKLGLGDEVYARLASEVTTVVHNAWKMDFNQQVDMFEQDCLRGTLNLMRFAQQSTKKTFAFNSSVATNMGKSASGKTIRETPIANDPSLALETGYAQSKFIVEVISQVLATASNIPVRIFRVGQLCGHSTLGYWNTTEMFPIMIASGLRNLNAMPIFDQQTVNWLPVDICAETIRTILIEHPSTGYSLHNLVNPAAISWSQFLDALTIASGVDFERVSMNEWVARLLKVSEEKDGVSGAKLLGFFEGMAQSVDAEAKFDNLHTTALVQSLRDCTSVDSDLLALYLQRWREVGFA